MDAKFQALVNLCVELLVVVLLLGNFCAHSEALPHKVVHDHARRGQNGDALASDAINVLLVLRHAVDALFQADLFVPKR